MAFFIEKIVDLSQTVFVWFTNMTHTRAYMDGRIHTHTHMDIHMDEPTIGKGVNTIGCISPKNDYLLYACMQTA